jgi:hypothetical protein
MHLDALIYTYGFKGCSSFVNLIESFRQLVSQKVGATDDPDLHDPNSEVNATKKVRMINSLIFIGFVIKQK